MICGASSVTLAVRLIGSPSLYSSALGEPYAFWYASNPVCRALTTAGKTLGATIILATRLARTDPISLNLAAFSAAVSAHGGGTFFKKEMTISCGVDCTSTLFSYMLLALFWILHSNEKVVNVRAVL